MLPRLLAPRRHRPALAGVFGTLLLALGLLLAGCTSGSGPAFAPSSSPPRGATASAPAWAADMATVRAGRLPAEARRTLARIDRGGPFPYAKDGTVFGNYEGELPRHRRGYYHEYTVRTPGERDRGARRIVTGSGGEIYYTDDHYKSFKAVLR
ncbi:ribonuclease domain-containing protein [Streptomyces beihaiensis]|uniref:Ribonuclease N n=1 Tax=Streptomyces beihaiensis TaxID=2984495 RepID=A0ABT3U3Z3_9ACTN|nr:ribonuclease domain-containing protein [Streptomyces beihaiensis]MCX3062965.1 ribonuclease N [Streptomyces beihaiensis]